MFFRLCSSGKLSAWSRIATILTAEKSVDGVSRLLLKADLERLKAEKTKPVAKLAEYLGYIDFFVRM